MHSAKKIISLNSDKKISSDFETLKEILHHEEVKNKPVCVISITGTFRQGKSFMLNFLLSYLNIVYKRKAGTSENWISVGGSNISGFEWRSGKERHTTGILMWSEVFIAELPSGEKVTVVLLDTQGTFDNKTSKQHCAAIFAISTLISSVQIYNLKNQINQADLEHLECFSGFGQLLLGQSSTKPFQNLWFLIRDWQNPHENNYGVNGGQKYLDEFLTAFGQPEDLRKQNENIRSLFEKMFCCLLPYPGDSVATNPNFRGDLGEIREKFLRCVEEFVPKILSPTNLVTKTINGTKIKTGDLVGLIQTYCQHFMDEEIPQLKSMYLATCVAHHDMALTEAEALYENSMDIIINSSEALNEDFLEAEHEMKKTEAVRFFQTKNVMGEKEMKIAYEEKLTQKLVKKFEEYRKLNGIKLDKVLERAAFREEIEDMKEKLEDELEEQKKEHQLALDVQRDELLELQRDEREELENRIRELQSQREEQEEDPGQQLVQGVVNVAKGIAQCAVGAAHLVMFNPVRNTLLPRIRWRQDN